MYKNGVVCAVRYKEDNWGNKVSYVLESVKKRCSWKGAILHSGLKPRGRRIATVRNCYQATTSEDTAGWNRHNGYCGDL
jgi:hypothetical protein